MRKSPSKKRSARRSARRSTRRSANKKRSAKRVRKLRFSCAVHPIQHLTKEWVDRQFDCPVTDFVYEELRLRVLYLISYFIITEGQFIKTKAVKDKAFTKSQFENLVKSIRPLRAEQIDILHAMIETFLEECIVNMKREYIESGDQSVDLIHGLRWWNKFKDQNGITDELHDEIRDLYKSI